MPNRVPLQSIVVKRNDKAVVPPIGAVFEFTDEEVADIERINPDAISENVSVPADSVAAPSKDKGKGKAKGGSDDL